MNEKKCKQTGQPIISGRSDKKFINDKARSKYHYLKNKEKNKIFERRDKQMHKNHFILDKYYIENGKGIPLDFLIQQGFDPKVYFGHYSDFDSEQDLITYRYSYNYEFRYEKDSKRIIIKKMEWRIKSKF